MPLTLPTANFATWKDIPAGYLYPADCDSDNHIHVLGSKRNDAIEIKSVSIKINGSNTNLAPSSALTAFKFRPSVDTKFPDGDLGDKYKNALRDAGVTS